MAIIKFPMEWVGGLSKKYKLPAGVMPISMNVKKYWSKVKAFFTELSSWIDANNGAPEIFVTIEVNYKDGTNKQKSMAWSLYEIMAREMNGGMVGSKDQMTQPMDLYRQNIVEWRSIHSPVFLRLTKKHMVFVCKPYRIVQVKHDTSLWMDITSMEGKDYLESCASEKIITLCVFRGMSMMDKKELSAHIEGIFNQLADMDINVASSVDVKNYFLDHSEWKQKQKITEDPEPITREAYRERHPMCEATGGKPHDLAHIRSAGSQGGREKSSELIDPTNYLHLSREAHNLQHSQGWGKFLKQYPHLKTKVNMALKGGPMFLKGGTNVNNK